MKRMIITGVRRLLFGGQPAQQAMGAGSNDPLTGDKRTVESAQLAFPSGRDGRSSGKKRLFFQQKTAVLSAKNACSLGRNFLFPREEIFVPSGGNNFSFPHLALRFLLVIVMILGGVLESGAADVNSISSLRNAIENGGTQIITLTGDITIGENDKPIIVSSGDITINLQSYNISNGYSGRLFKTYYTTKIFVVKEGATLTINGSGTVYNKEAGENSAIYVDGGVLNVKGNVNSENYAAITVYSGTVNISSGEVSSNSSKEALEILGGTVNITGGTIKSDLSVGGTAISTVTISNGSLTVNNNSTIKAKTGTATAIGIQISGEGNVTINGGTINAEVTTGEAKAIEISGGSLTVNGGTIEGHRTWDLSTGKPSYGLYISGTSIVSLKGGTYIATNVIDKKYAISSNVPLEKLLVEGYGVYQDGSLVSAEKTSTGQTVTIEPIKYKFNYHTNNDNNEIKASTGYYYTIEDRNISFLPTDIGKKAHYYFQPGEWYYESNFQTKVTTDNLPTPTTDVVDIYARWSPVTYQITFNSQGGTQIDPLEATIESGSVSLEGYRPTRPYYEFDGWYDEGSSSPVTKIEQVTSNQILYAKWKKITYTITYDENGGMRLEGGFYPESYQIGDAYTISAVNRGDDRFGGWKDSKTGSLLTDNKVPSTAPRDLSLIAVWDNYYTLIFKTNDPNVSVNPISAYASDAVTLPSAERTGYTLKGWKLGSTIYPARSSYQAKGNDTFEAVWEAISYTIKFIDNGKEVKSQTYTIESPEIVFSSLSKDYWLFKGWKDEQGQSMEKIPTGNTGDRTLTASWEPITYVLTYDYGYDNKQEEESYTFDEREAKELKSVSREGYRFLGWFLGDTETKVSSRPVNLEQAKEVHITIKAHWELMSYPVTFYLNDGTEAALSEQMYNYTVETGIPAANMPGGNEAKRTGYTFDSWNTKKDGTGTTVTEVAAGTAHLEFYAQWIPNRYNITYHLNGGNELSSAPTTFLYNEGVTLPKEEMRKDHYTFAGWTREESSTNYVTQIEKNTYTTDQVFYAQWTPLTYTFQFEENGGMPVNDLSYLYESEETLKKCYRNGYTFEGWYFDSALTNAVGETITDESIQDNSPTVITLYAKWNLINYKISYNLYYGIFPEGTAVPTTYNIETSVQSLPTPVRAGYTFGSWYRDDLLTDPLDLTKEAISVNNYGDKTFYATWSRGFSVILSQPKEGVISVKQGDQVIALDTPLAKGTELTISATPTTSGYVLKQLVINGQAFTTSPQKVTMGEANLIISAEFVASTKPTVSAPTITTDPDREKVDAETLVKVTLAKTDAASTLYYSLNTQEERPYSAPFVVDGGVGDTVTIRAIARREGYTDGITTRKIVFDGRLHLTFDLPAGVTATAPDGGAVVDAIVKGGTFEFKLQVDKSYFASTDSLQVMANDSLIKPGSSGVYRLYDQKGDVKVVVKGLKAHTCVVTLLQTEHGQIAFAEGDEESSRTINYGTELTLQATADEDYKFSKWSTGSQQNPVTIKVMSDTTISATFVNDYKAYQITLPEVEGVTAKPFTGYSTEVKRDGTFKFYLVIAKGYHEDQLVVRADGEELVKNKGGYALYHITKNICISVEGIVRDTFSLALPPKVEAWKVASMKEAAKDSLYAESTLLLQAVAPEGQRFLKWTDGSTENPRLVSALDAKQLYPLFTTLSETPTAKLNLVQTAGAGILGSTSNLDVVNLGEQASVKVVVLPAYSQSAVRLLANGEQVEPNVQLRAASESKTYYYQVPVAEAEVELKVEGLRLNQYQLTVAESTGGRVEGVPTAKVTHGDAVTLTAKPAEGMTFVRWWDGNTRNPYPYTVTGDQAIRAYFVGENSPVDNESVTAEEVRVCSPTTGGLWVELPVPQDIWLWDSSGRLLLHRFDSGTVRLAVPAGIYLLQCGMQPAFKVVVRH